MLVFNEGLPRSGKSYDAVLSHILPAIKAGRRVFARLNGLDHDKISAHLEMSVETVRNLLVLVGTADVKKLFLAIRPGVSDGGEEWAIPEQLKNALFVIDECHEFYVADRAPINPAIENFFALCGQNGMDGLLLSQWYKRLHSSLRARIERKNVFQKLTAVGLQKKYTVRRYHAMGPDRFELVGTDTEAYQPAIFPLYKGYADGADNTAVYTAGGKTVWAKIGKYAVFVIPLVGLGLWSFTRFFSGHSGLAAAPHTLASPPSASFGIPAHPLAAAAPAAGQGGGDMIKHVDTTGMPSTVAYVFDLCDQARARLAGVVDDGAKSLGVIEWVQTGGKVLDRLTFAQVRDLGVTIDVHPYGVRLSYGKKDAVVTSWPLDVPASGSSSSPSTPSASSPVASSGRAADLSAGDGRQWPQGKIAQSYTPPQLVAHEAGSDWHPSHD